MKRLATNKLSTIIIGLVFVIIAFLLVISMDNITNMEEEHIERVSEKCAKEGYGIKKVYKNDGESYYICNKKGSADDLCDWTYRK